MKDNKCLLLLKAQLRNEFGGKQKSKGRTITMAAIILVSVVMAAYAFGISFGLGSLGMASLVPSYGVALTSIVMLFFTVFKANGVLFAYKEYDFLMALPVSASTVIASRFMTMYLMNLLLTAGVMLPMGAGYVIWEKPGALFYLGWVLGILAVPLIPTTLAALFGALIILFSSRFKYANGVVTVVSLAATIGILVASMSLGGMDDGSFDVEKLQSLAEMLLGQIHRIYPPAVLFYGGIVEGNFLSMAGFLVLSLLWYVIFIKALSTVYKKLNTALTTYRTHSDYRLTEMKASSQMLALWKKEWKRFLSSTTYFMNMGMGAIMTVLCGVGCLFVEEELLNSLFQSEQAGEIVMRILPFAIGALLSMSCTTSVSLSIEGKHLWIIKSLPIEDVTIFKSKILMNLSLQIPAGLLAAILVNISFPLPTLMRIMVFVTPIACACFNSVWGMLINLKMPDYDWTSETTLVKQSMPAMAGMLGGLGGGLLLVAMEVLLWRIDAVVVTAVLTCFLAAGAYGLWQYVKRQKIAEA